MRFEPLAKRYFDRKRAATNGIVAIRALANKLARAWGGEPATSHVASTASVLRSVTTMASAARESVPAVLAAAPSMP